MKIFEGKLMVDEWWEGIKLGEQIIHFDDVQEFDGKRVRLTIEVLPDEDPE